MHRGSNGVGLDRLLEPGQERRVGEVILDTEIRQEGQVTAIAGRQPSIVVSRVRTSVVKPDFFARSRKLSSTDSSVGQYNWYHRGASPPASAICSNECEAWVE